MYFFLKTNKTKSEKKIKNNKEKKICYNIHIIYYILFKWVKLNNKKII